MNNPLDTVFFDKAVIFATEAHKGTERRGKAYPYIIHPMEAASIVATITNDQEMLAAAVLHDTVEDTEVTIEQIREKFGERVAELVRHETAPMDESLTWRERKAIQIRQLADAPYDSKVVALGDKLSNMRAIARDYAEQGDELWKLFHAKDPKDHEWHYRGLATALRELEDTFAYKEFEQLINQVF